MSTLKTTAIQHLNGSSPSIYLDSNNRVGIGTSSPGYLLDIDQATNDAQNFRLKNEEVSLFLGTYGTGSSYPREVTINGSRADSGSLPNLRIAGQGGIKFCVDFNTERMNINSSGHVTKPYQPAFKVGRTGSGNVTTDATIPFDDVVINVGGHFNTSTYRFTAPVAGYYLLSMGGMNHQSSTGASLFRMWKNGTQISYMHIIATHPSSSSYTFVQYMNASDYIYVTGQHYHYNQASTGYDYPYFSGYLLG